jgi:hypothetical protein
MLIVKTYYDSYQQEAKAALPAGASKGDSSKGKPVELGNKVLEISPKTSTSSPKASKGLVNRFCEERSLSEYRAKIAIKLFKDTDAPDLVDDVIAGRRKLSEAEKELAKRHATPKKSRSRIASNRAIEVEDQRRSPWGKAAKPEGVKRRCSITLT